MTINKDVKKVLFDAGIGRLIDWLQKRHWTIDIDYCNQDEVQPGNKQVTINSRQGIEKQLYSLLHECGHILVQQNWERYEKNYPAVAKMNCYATVNRQLEKSSKYKVDILSEEIEAWRRGKSLAGRLGVFIDEEKYNNLASECIYSYIQWATK